MKKIKFLYSNKKLKIPKYKIPIYKINHNIISVIITLNTIIILPITVIIIYKIATVIKEIENKENLLVIVKYFEIYIKIYIFQYNYLLILISF